MAVSCRSRYTVGQVSVKFDLLIPDPERKNIDRNHFSTLTYKYGRSYLQEPSSTIFTANQGLSLTRKLDRDQGGASSDFNRETRLDNTERNKAYENAFGHLSS
jgi:hypothetical protein